MPTKARGQDMPTTISVSEELADDLYARKGRGESYEDVIRRLIEKADRCEEEENIAESGSSGGNIETGNIKEEEPREHEEVTDESDLKGLIDDIVDEGMLPGSGQKLEKRREALQATVEYLTEHREAEPKDFKRDVYPDHQAEYTDGEDPPNSWWKNCIYKGMRELAERSDDIRKPDQTGEWRYTGESA